MVGFLRACTSLSFTVTTQPTPYERHANRKMGVELVGKRETVREKKIEGWRGDREQCIPELE